MNNFKQFFSKTRRKLNPKLYDDLKFRFREDIKDELRSNIPFDELSKRKDEIRQLAFKKVLFSDVDNDNYSGKFFIKNDTNLIRKFINQNSDFFSAIIFFRNFFQKASFFSRFFFYFLAFFLFFSLEYYLHYYPPFSPTPFHITFDDIKKNIPPFF